MSTPAALLLFIGSLGVTLLSAGFFADRLDHIGPRLGLPEAIVGLLTALAADAPEISSAVVALARGQKDVGLGVVLGSNAFNLAAMIGLSALLTGAVSTDRDSLLLEGAVGVTAAFIVLALATGVLPASAALALVAVLAGGYLVIAARSPTRRPHTLRGAHADRLWKPAALILPAVALIALGAIGMVHAALTLAGRWHVSPTLVGVLALAVLTSLPNAFTAARLARAGRGSALVSETFNSNTINLVGGVIAPALVVSLAARSTLDRFDLAWVLGMTLVSIGLLARPGGVRRHGAALLIALYVVFVVTQIAAA